MNKQTNYINADTGEYLNPKLLKTYDYNRKRHTPYRRKKTSNVTEALQAAGLMVLVGFVFYFAVGVQYGL